MQGDQRRGIRAAGREVREAWTADRPVILALAFLQAWSYVTFFSGVLVGYFSSTDSLPEYYWSLAGLGAACVALAMLAGGPERLRRVASSLQWLAAGLMCLGVAMIGAAFRLFDEEVLLYGAGGFIAGCGEAYLLVCLFRGLIERSVKRPWMSVVLAFSISFLLYLALLPLPSPYIIAVILILPFASVVAGRSHAGEPRPDGAGAQDGAAEGLRQGLGQGAFSKPLIGAYALVSFLWFNFAFFRFIASPWHLATEPWYYFIMFTAAAVSVGVMGTWVVLRHPKRKRWESKLAVLVLSVSYAILYIDFESAANGAVAFMITFVCMIGTQITVLMYGLEAGRCKGAAVFPALFACMASTGAGVFAGVQCGLLACRVSGGSIPPTVPMIIVAVLFALIMIVAIPDPGGSEQQGDAKAGPDGEGAGAAAEAEPLGLQAKEFAGRFQLSERETEVLMLLLRGRSRPFIAHELYLSIGTVNTHISNIYRKVGVHSLQDLITSATAPEPYEPAEGPGVPAATGRQKET